MSIPVEEITEAVLSLPIDARALLADRLVESLDPIEDEEVRELWGVEALRRLKEVETGAVETLDGELVLSEAREALRK